MATLIAVYGLFMTPLGWGWAAFVWGYALAWFLVTDRVKLVAYRIFDPTATPLLAKEAPDDLTPQIAKRAYELYEQEGRREGHAVSDWLQAEQEVRDDRAPKQANASQDADVAHLSHVKPGSKATAKLQLFRAAWKVTLPRVEQIPRPRYQS